ncbi:MAG: membrane-bound dehydrogenase domain-containing protein [Limisphaerales bacterium]|nr:MAG: membrane-bound dehydrogenase domain-containing protein [Limisphaerales bacterium]KAG0506975.1 MAG: membrane-bound dehydrogenase domain-containing protein [Limisphaerales bacterium]TXT47201.1 MAG: membrane-bound dehydrogenase domain-containing protein [Limisphaerales bacterium]
MQVRSLARICRSFCLLPFTFCLPLAAQLPPGVTDSQKAGDVPTSPAESLKKITLPPGFRAQLFAAEPQVMQPIAMEFDDRGRLWVVENFSYPTLKKNNGVTNPAPDRIVIFTDKSGLGHASERKVFLNAGRNVTSALPGFGGVWVLSLPDLLFIPDANGDDVPDGPPVVALTGWNINAGHNFVNGLAWGPDGWLWGRHGITTKSTVGRPGSPTNEWVTLDCSIWRYHPVTKQFETVCRGTTNPWGLDWDENGQAFFSNNVIGHFWHVIPGAFYKRMFGTHDNPHLYELMDSCSDHLHWAGAKWSEARGGPAHDALGGGHSHCGLMIYQGDNFPAEWRGRAFIGNIHGNRVLYDVPARAGSGYTAKHGGAFLMANDPWFRSTVQITGPDGSVFIADWSDLGECHDSDGSYRSSGRIYKVTHGPPKPAPPVKTAPAELNLAKLSDAELMQLLTHANEWHRRHAQRLLQERAVVGELALDTVAWLHKLHATERNTSRQLRLLWALHVTSVKEAPLLKAQMGLLTAQLNHASEHARWWAIRLLTEDKQVFPALLAKFVTMAREDKSAFVRLGLSSALQRLPVNDRWELATALLAHAEDAADKDLPLLTWYGIEPAVAADQTKAALLLAKCQQPQVRQFITRRLTTK